MKKIAISAFAAAMLSTGVAHAAGTAAATFDVNLTLTPTCVIATASNGAGLAANAALGTTKNIAVSYSAFQTTDGTGSTDFFVRCSTGLAYSVGLDSFSAIVDGTTGLTYNLALKTANTGTASTAVGSVTAQTGVAAGNQYFVQAWVGAGQAGTTTAGTANNTRTVTVTY